MAARKIFISVAEDSADLHAASLVAAARTLLPDVEFYGLTGPRLRAMGVRTVFDFASHAAMLTGVLKLVGRGRAALRAAEESWRAERPDLALLMDSTALHLPMARRAKQFGLRVLYYIAPQTWASRSWRNAQLREWVDQVACILPFEEEWFRSHGVAATYVGHPLAEAVAAQMGGMAVRDKQTGRMPVPPGETGRMPAPRKEMGGIPLPPVSIPPAPERERPLVAILPGSRRQVVAANLPVKLRVARMMAERRPELRFAILCASEERRREIEEISSELRVATNEWGNNGESRMASCEIGGAGILPASDQNGNREGAISASSTKGSAGSTAITAAMRVQVVPSLQRDALLRSADLALITSGTASLEAAFYSLPMVVTYEIGARLGRVVGFIRPQLIQTPHLCIVNVLAGRRIVPEFMPHVGDASCVARTALQLLQDHLWRRRMTTDLTDVVSSLGERQASAAVCRLIAEKF